MKFTSCFILVLTNAIFLLGQTIPFNQENWDIKAKGYILEAHEGEASMYLKDGVAQLKEGTLQNGIIEFDIFMKERRSFSGILFRMEDQKNYEEIYLRGHLDGLPDAMQYSPVNNGAAAWQLYHDQGRAIMNGRIGWRVEYQDGYNALFNYPYKRWLHVKLVILNNRADLYLDNQERPVLQIRELKRASLSGGIAVRSFRGGVHFANFSYKKTGDITLADLPSFKERPMAEGVINQWQVSNTFNEKEVAGTKNLSKEIIKAKSWQKAKTEKSGLLNITTLQEGSREKNTVFTKVIITSETDQLKRLDFGYSDRVKVYCNNQLMYSGNNGYRTRDYRYLGTIGYFDAVYLPLKKGKNELVLAVSETFGGWGVQGKLENIDSLKME